MNRKATDLAACVVGVVLAIIYAGYQMSSSNNLEVSVAKKGFSPAVREIPLVIPPQSDLRGTIATRELHHVLWLAVPRWLVPKPNFMLHALRLWGPRAKFGDDLVNPYRNGTPSGERLLELLTDSDDAERSGVVPFPFLYNTSMGPSVQYEAGGYGGIAHADQYLKAMAEIGVSSSTEVTLPDGQRATLEDLLRDSLRNFSISQELDFTAVAYSRWLPPAREWQDRYGERHTFDELTSALLDNKPGEGACGGIHKLYALVNLLRANEFHPILHSSTLTRIENHLVHVSSILEARQEPRGFWLANWADSVGRVHDESSEYQALVMTGHHLEWMSMAPSHLRPRREVVQRAARALVRHLGSLNITTVSGSYPPYSHAVRGLALMEGVDPSSVVISERELGQ